MRLKIGNDLWPNMISRPHLRLLIFFRSHGGPGWERRKGTGSSWYIWSLRAMSMDHSTTHIEGLFTKMCKIKISKRKGSFFENQIYSIRKFGRGCIRIWTKCFPHKTNIEDLQQPNAFFWTRKLVTQLGKHHFLATCLQFSCDLALLGGPLSITH